MDTGIIAILLHQLPYQFAGLKIISTVVYLMNLAIFVGLMCLFVIHLSRHPQYAVHRYGTQIDDLAALTCPVVAYLTLVGMTAITTGQAWGYGWAILGYVLWWISAFLSLCTVFCTFYLALASLFIPLPNDRAHSALLSDVDVSPQLFLPIVAILTAATIGGLVTNFSPISARMSIPVIIVSYMFLGIGVLFAIVIYPHYLYHNFTRGFLDRTRQTASDILTIGPLGQAAGGFILLGAAAQSQFGDYHRGTFLQGSAGSALAAASVMIALLLLGFSFVLGLIVFTFLVENVRRWRLNIGWWTLIFPVGILTSKPLLC